MIWNKIKEVKNEWNKMKKSDFINVLYMHNFFKQKFKIQV